MAWRMRAGPEIPEWARTYVGDVKLMLLGERERWSSDVPEDTALEPLWEAFELVFTPARIRETVAAHPEVLDLPGPGAVAPTLGEVIGDVLREAIEPGLLAWMDEEAGVNA